MQMAAIKDFGAADFAHYDKLHRRAHPPDALIAMIRPGRHQRPLRLAPVPPARAQGCGRAHDHDFQRRHGRAQHLHDALQLGAAPHDDNPGIGIAAGQGAAGGDAFINADNAAPPILPRDGGAGLKLDEVLEILNDPDARKTTKPESLMKYADFMATGVSIRVRPAPWQAMFFLIHGAPGS